MGNFSIYQKLNDLSNSKLKLFTSLKKAIILQILYLIWQYLFEY